jgi:hypothetical protein
MSDVYTALQTAQAAFETAVARKSELAGNLNKAKSAAQEAANLAHKVLADTVAGSDTTDDDLLAARQTAERMDVAAEIASAKHEHAHQQTLQPQINLLAAQRDVVQFEFATEDAKLDATAVRVDEALAAARMALDAYAKQAQVTKAAHQRCHQHNNNVRSAIAHNELLAHKQQLGVVPTAAVPAYFGVAVPDVQLFLDLDRGKISARRQAVPSLAVLIQARGRQ